MRKFTLRIGGCGVVAACLLFAAVHGWARSARLDELVTVFWPTSILLAGSGAGTRLGVGELFRAAFSALMNGAIYFGVAWALWWALRLAGITKAAASAKDRFVSAILAVGLGFTLAVALAETAIHGLSKLGAEGLAGFWLVSANLFALVVITCVLSGWTMWWLRSYFGSRRGAPTPGSPRAAGKS